MCICVSFFPFSFDGIKGWEDKFLFTGFAVFQSWPSVEALSPQLSIYWRRWFQMSTLFHQLDTVACSLSLWEPSDKGTLNTTRKTCFEENANDGDGHDSRIDLLLYSETMKLHCNLLCLYDFSLGKFYELLHNDPHIWWMATMFSLLWSLNMNIHVWFMETLAQIVDRNISVTNRM